MFLLNTLYLLVPVRAERYVKYLIFHVYPSVRMYRCADKSLARPGRKHATATKL